MKNESNVTQALLKDTDISTWNMDVLEDAPASLQEAIADGINEALRLACEEPVEISLPYIWRKDEDSDEEGSDGMNGPPVSDPLTLDLMLPLGPEESVGPIWRVSLETLFIEEIEYLDGQFSGNKNDKQTLTVWRQGVLRILAKLDEGIAKIEVADAADSTNSQSP